jgi:S1-C subfamily serine protease
VNAYGTGTTTTYGTSTNYIPMTVDQHSYMAVYMAKFTFKVGLVLDPLTDADRQVIESNAGARVSIVVDGTPAFDADILPGDILLSIADRKLSGVNSLVEITDPMPAGPVPFKLWRNGQAIVKSVLLR